MIRLCPTKGQQTFFNKTFGCCRSVYNTLLYDRNQFTKENIDPLKEKYGYNGLIQELEKLNKKKDKEKVKEIKAKLKEIKDLINPVYKKFKERSVKELKESFLDEKPAASICTRRIRKACLTRSATCRQRTTISLNTGMAFRYIKRNRTNSHTVME